MLMIILAFADYSQLLLCKIFESTISSGSPTGFGMFIVVGLLALLQQPYEDYMQNVNPIFNRLLGYVTVALAVPLAAMRYDDLPLKSMVGILVFASVSAVALPMTLAYLLHMSESTVLAFATRAVTTPIALNIATLLHAPLTLVTLIVILSGVIGAAFHLCS